MIDLSLHVFETLRKDEEFILYRGKSNLAPPVLVLSPALQHPVPQSLNRLQHEYSLKEKLDSNWAIQPIAMGRNWDRPVLLLRDPGGVPLSQLVGPARNVSSSVNVIEDKSALANAGGRPLDLVSSLRIAIGLASAIGHLHQRGIIHKDIKPANLLVHLATGSVWLTGFGIASWLPRERQSPDPPQFIAGTLAYMAPEQTGRMNRSTDSRSDLYSFGITLYELLTGFLPFTATDAMEWVHCHIARRPVPPDERTKGIPGAVSAIVMRLLAKNAEERYQTAAGVASDLRRCLGELERLGHVNPFSLGTRDASDRLWIPEKLYGRDREVKVLLDGFERIVAGGSSRLALVSGHSGIGKSSVVNELQKAIVLPRGIFIAGKCDQYRRDIPYATLAQAFQTLVRQILSRGEGAIADWRNAILQAVGPNGQLIINLIPELELVIGKQPSVPELPPKETQNRFEAVFRRFLCVFAQQEHPVTLFLDDLQWLDLATLNFIEDLLTDPDVEYLLILGAYRDHEVSPSHPLMLTLTSIRKAGVTVDEIVLKPLSFKDVNDFVADALRCERVRAEALSRLVHKKTAGNPFFVVQFLTALTEEHLLEFNTGKMTWECDLTQIQARDFTDNVVDLMVTKLNRLPARTQKTLKLLACLGNSAEIPRLSVIQGRSEKQIHSDPLGSHPCWSGLTPERFLQVSPRPSP